MRFFSWLDVFTDLVVDVTGAGGAQLTRLDVLATIRAGKYLTLHARLRPSVGDRDRDVLDAPAQPIASTSSPAPSRTTWSSSAPRATRGARDVDFTFGKVSIFADGRFRTRALVTLSDDPQFAASTGSWSRPALAYDVTFGVRDRGSLAGIRAGLWYTYHRRLSLAAPHHRRSSSGAAFSTIG